MNLHEFAIEVARNTNGEVKVVEKENGVILTGIQINQGHINPVVYIDKMYEEGFSVEEASARVMITAEKNRVEGVDLAWLQDYEKVKPMLRARLLNEESPSEIKKTAGNGFDDLVIVPVIRIEDLNKETRISTCRIQKNMLKTWGVTEEEVIAQAEYNSKFDTQRRNIIDVLTGIQPEIEVPEPAYPMYVITNTENCYGAYAVIPMLDELKEMFPDGFMVIPSSVHEVIVTPTVMPKVLASEIIEEVNETEVRREDQLSNHPYFFNT